MSLAPLDRAVLVPRLEFSQFLNALNSFRDEPLSILAVVLRPEKLFFYSGPDVKTRGGGGKMEEKQSTWCLLDYIHKKG